MAQLGQAFDPNSVEPNQFDDLPVGEYIAQIVESSVEATKTGTGMLLKLTWQVVDGQYENRKFWQQINFQNQSAQAQLIGQQQLKSICDSIGYTQHVEDSEVLHYQPCRVRLGMGKANGNYPARVEVKKVSPLQAQPPAGKAPTAQPQPGATTQPQPQAAARPATPARAPVSGPPGARPWGQRANA
jgi:Protein of unknown function (DUF669)